MRTSRGMTNGMSLFILGRRFVALGLFALASSALAIVPSCSGAVCEPSGEGCPCTTSYECLTNSCYAAGCDGTCHMEVFPPGGACLLVRPCAEPGNCIMGVCTAEPQCVECLEDTHCAPGHTCEVDNVCSRCDDGMKNGDETGIDCGGSCPLCPGTCNVDGDCPDGYCWEGLCISCYDGIQNGDETGIDCGPSGTHCLKCLGMNCSGGGDWACVSQNCEDFHCCPAVCPLCFDCEPSGACEPLGAGFPDKYNKDPANVCDGDFRCNGQGKCLLTSGQPCTQDSECAYSVCLNGTCK